MITSETPAWRNLSILVLFRLRRFEGTIDPLVLQFNFLHDCFISLWLSLLVSICDLLSLIVFKYNGIDLVTKKRSWYIVNIVRIVWSAHLLHLLGFLLYCHLGAKPLNWRGSGGSAPGSRVEGVAAAGGVQGAEPLAEIFYFGHVALWKMHQKSKIDKITQFWTSFCEPAFCCEKGTNFR